MFFVSPKDWQLWFKSQREISETVAVRYFCYVMITGTRIGIPKRGWAYFNFKCRVREIFHAVPKFSMGNFTPSTPKTLRHLYCLEVLLPRVTEYFDLDLDGRDSPKRLFALPSSLLCENKMRLAIVSFRPHCKQNVLEKNLRNLCIFNWMGAAVATLSMIIFYLNYWNLSLMFPIELLTIFIFFLFLSWSLLVMIILSRKRPC